MKRLFCCTVLFLILHETSIISQPFKFQWARPIGGSSNEIPRIMKVDNHGNVYLFFETESSEFSIDHKFYYKWINPENRPINCIIVKYDSRGNLLWGRSLLTDIGMEAIGITIDQDNNLLLSVYNQGSLLKLDTMIIYSKLNIYLNAAVILKLDPGGSLLDYSYFTSSQDVYNIGGITHDKNNNYYLTIKSRAPVLNMHGDTVLHSDLKRGNYFSILKLTKTLDLNWITKMYNVSSYFSDIKVDGEDNIIVYGMFRGRELQLDSFVIKNSETIYLNGDYGEDEVFLLKLNPEGKAQWLSAIHGKDIEYCGYNDISFDKENNIYLGGMFESDTLWFNERNKLYKDKTPVNYFDIYYAKYDKNGNCVWARTIERQIKDLIDNMTIHVLNDNYLLISSNYTNDNLKIGNTNLTNKGLSDCFVLLAKTDGEIVTGTSFGGNKEDYEQQITTYGNKVYVFAAFSSTELQINDSFYKNDTIDGSLDAILIAYNLDSLVSTNNVDGKVINLHIFPNPATTSISIQLPENIEMGLCYYNIYSIKGDFITSGIIHSTKSEVNLTSLPSGEYILTGGNLKANKFYGKFTVMR